VLVQRLLGHVGEGLALRVVALHGHQAGVPLLLLLLAARRAGPPQQQRAQHAAPLPTAVRRPAVRVHLSRIACLIGSGSTRKTILR